ncbi:hypothetical protein HQ487_04555 [Candidatus Uhrbacteria bacterium]|nr:hypothetical protein [Candidatus Uhrbacteria bacterium]
MGIREELHEGVFGLMACLMPLDNKTIVLLYRIVPERGEALWVRFRAWQKDGHEDEGFDKFTKDMIETWLKSQLGASTSRPASAQDGFARPRPTQGVDTVLKNRILQILSSASSRDDAKEQIKKEVKRRLSPRPQSCSVNVSWSSDPKGRSVYVGPQGHPSFSVTTRS